MDILVVNGSPKGPNSVTLQTVNYLKILFPGHAWRELHAGQRIRALERDFSEAKALLEEADLILFCYPVYTFLAPAQLHRFLELAEECGADVAGKFAAQITTSKHFYDVTAHEFVRERCGDLGLRYLSGLSADMEDLLSEKGRREAEQFFRYLLWSSENGAWDDPPRQAAPFRSPVPATVPDEPVPQTGDGRIVIVTDLEDGDGPLGTMIRRFRAVTPRRTEVVDLRGFDFAGGCLGCFHCASGGECVYRDGFDALLRERIQTADAIVYAFSVRGHSMGYRFKLYDDRQFCNGHRTVTMGKPVGYLADGAVSREPNLRMLLEARAQVGGNWLAGIAGDERDTDAGIDRMAARLDWALRSGYRQPANFYGVGGLKIFRDLIWQMQGLMREDHRFYREHGFYDFPQKRRGTVAAMYLVGAMMRSKSLSKKLGGKMTEGMLMPYEKVLKQARDANTDRDA